MSEFKCEDCGATASHKDLHMCEIDSLRSVIGLKSAEIKRLSSRIEELEAEVKGLEDLLDDLGYFR